MWEKRGRKWRENCDFHWMEGETTALLVDWRDDHLGPRLDLNSGMNASSLLHLFVFNVLFLMLPLTLAVAAARSAGTLCGRRAGNWTPSWGRVHLLWSHFHLKDDNDSSEESACERWMDG